MVHGRMHGGLDKWGDRPLSDWYTSSSQVPSGTPVKVVQQPALASLLWPPGTVKYKQPIEVQVFWHSCSVKDPWAVQSVMQDRWASLV